VALASYWILSPIGALVEDYSKEKIRKFIAEKYEAAAESRQRAKDLNNDTWARDARFHETSAKILELIEKDPAFPVPR
jgi:hypothetical protein